MLTRNNITKKLLYSKEHHLIKYMDLVDWKIILMSRYISEETIKKCINYLPLKYVLKYQKLSKNLLCELKNYFIEYIEFPQETDILSDMLKEKLKINNPDINEINLNAIFHSIEKFKL